MAKYNGSFSSKELRKLAGKQFAVKQYAYAIVVTRFPDMSHVKPSKQQNNKREKFKEAVAYTQSILKDEKLKNAYRQKLMGKQTVYHFELKEYLLLQ